MVRLYVGVLVLVAAACSPAMKTDAKLSLSLSSVALSDAIDARELELPSSLCYALHATGRGLTRVRAENTPCGPENGIGVFTPRTYTSDDHLDWSLKVGTERHVELLGFESPLGTQNGHAVCGRLEVELVPRSAEASDLLPRFRIEGQEVRGAPYVFATSVRTLTPKSETLALEAVAEPAGAAWLRSGMSDAPAFCRPPRPASSEGPLFSSSGAGLTEPIRGQKGAAVLHSFGQAMTVPGAAVRSTSGRAELKAPGSASTPGGR